MPRPLRKLASLGTCRRTKPSPPANHAQPARMRRRDTLRVSAVSVVPSVLEAALTRRTEDERSRSEVGAARRFLGTYYVGVRRSKTSALTTGRDAGAGWSCVEYGRFSRCPRWTRVVEPPPSRLIALSTPRSTITPASSSIERPPSTFERRPSQASATSHSAETPRAARG